MISINKLDFNRNHLQYFLDNKPFTGLCYDINPYTEDGNNFILYKIQNGVVVSSRLSAELPATNPLGRALYE